MSKTIDNIVKRFRSCFICGVEVHSEYIVLEDSGRNLFIVDKQDKQAFESFVPWFKNVYLKGIPQVLTVIEYSIVPKNNDESYCKVNKIVANSLDNKKEE